MFNTQPTGTVISRRLMVGMVVIIVIVICIYIYISRVMGMMRWLMLEVIFVALVVG